jgi:hypothetical protein
MKKIIIRFHIQKNEHFVDERQFQRKIDNADASGANHQKNGSIGS